MTTCTWCRLSWCCCFNLYEHACLLCSSGNMAQGRITKLLLERLGCDALLAHSITEAIDQCQQVLFDIIVLDGDSLREVKNDLARDSYSCKRTVWKVLWNCIYCHMSPSRISTFHCDVEYSVFSGLWLYSGVVVNIFIPPFDIILFSLSDGRIQWPLYKNSVGIPSTWLLLSATDCWTALRRA